MNANDFTIMWRNNHSGKIVCQALSIGSATAEFGFK